MFTVFHNLIGLVLIILILPQTPTENIVLRKLLETGYFPSYTAGKNFLNRITWIIIFVFLFVTFILNF